MISSQKHRKIIGYAFIALALYLLFTMFGARIEDAPLWQRILIYVHAPLFLLAGYSQLKDKPWAIWVSLPISLELIVIFPIGTLMSAYFLWASIRLENDSEKRSNSVFKKLACLTLIDFLILTFLCFLIPYGAIARDTIGGLNFLAASIALFLCCVGVISKIISKSKLGWVYVLLAIMPISILLLRSFESGYGP